MRCPLDQKAIDAAQERMVKAGESAFAKPSKLNPMNWPTKVKVIVGAALVAGLTAAGFGPEVSAAITSLLFGS